MDPNSVRPRLSRTGCRPQSLSLWRRTYNRQYESVSERPEFSNRRFNSSLTVQMVDEYPEWLDYVMAGVAVVMFVGYAGAMRWLELEMNPGLGLALGASGLGALGGVVLVSFTHRGVPATRRLRLVFGVQAALVTVPVLTVTSTVDHSGFRAAFLACGVGMAVFSVLLMGVSLLGSEQRGSVGDTASEPP